MRKLSIPILCTLLGASLVSSSAMAKAVDVAPVAPRIVGGTPSQDCAWPSTVGVGNCTGTLIHPKVVVYAAHCGSKIKQVVFGPNIKTPDPTRVVPTSKCEIYPGGGVTGNDVAYCLLKKEVTDVPIIPPAMGSDTELIQKKQAVWAVGYGYYNQDRDYGIKHEVELSITDFTSAEKTILLAGGNGKDACQGDSGGPLFMELPDERGFRLIGVTSFGFEGVTGSQSLPCGFGGGWAVLHHHMPWLEKQTGLDLSPCHDALGNSDPDKRCGAAPLTPAKASGEWPETCSFGEQSPALRNLPPSIRWTESVSTSPREIGKPFDIQVEVSDDEGVEKVELFVNDEAQDSVAQAPYRWSIEIPDSNELILQARAVDREGQVGHAKKLVLPLKTRTDLDGSSKPGDQDPSSPPSDSANPDEPSKAVPPSGIESSRSCSFGGSAPSLLSLGLIALLLPRRRSR